MKLGVIAGTATDTDFGLQYVIANRFEGISRSCSKNAHDQLDMQLHHPKELADRVITLAKEMIDEGAEGIYLYCNSMATAIDMQYVRNRISKKLVTPLDVYAECASMYDHIFVIAANCQSLAGIERVIKTKNPLCLVSGAALQTLVLAIEDHLAPQDICEKLSLREFLYYFTEMEADALIFGCTHFPYILKQVKDSINVPTIDPGQRMLEMLCEAMHKA